MSNPGQQPQPNQTQQPMQDQGHKMYQHPPALPQHQNQNQPQQNWQLPTQNARRQPSGLWRPGTGYDQPANTMPPHQYQPGLASGFSQLQGMASHPQQQFSGPYPQQQFVGPPPIQGFQGFDGSGLNLGYNVVTPNPMHISVPVGTPNYQAPPGYLHQTISPPFQGMPEQHSDGNPSGQVADRLNFRNLNSFLPQQNSPNFMCSAPSQNSFVSSPMPEQHSDGNPSGQVTSGSNFNQNFSQSQNFPVSSFMPQKRFDGSHGGQVTKQRSNYTNSNLSMSSQYNQSSQSDLPRPIHRTPGHERAQIRDSSVHSRQSETPRGRPQNLNQGTVELVSGGSENSPVYPIRNQKPFGKKKNPAFNRTFTNAAFKSIVIENTETPQIVQKQATKNAPKDQSSTPAGSRVQKPIAQRRSLNSPTCIISEARVVSMCDICYLPNHFKNTCKAGQSVEVTCDGCGMPNHTKKDCRWVKLNSRAKNPIIQTPQASDFNRSGGGTKRPHSQIESGQQKAGSYLMLAKSHGFPAGQINPYRAIPTSRNFAKSGEIKVLKAPCTYTVCIANWDSAMGILTDPKPTKEMRKEPNHPPLFVLFGDGFSNVPGLAMNMHRSQTVVVRSVMKILDRSGREIKEHFLDDGETIFGNVPRSAHLAIDFTLDPYISAYVIQNQIAFVSSRGRLQIKDTGRAMAVTISSLNLGRETNLNDNQISHEFTKTDELPGMEPVWVDLFQVTRNQFEKLGALTIPKDIFEYGRLKAFPPGFLVKAIRPISKDDREKLVKLGQLDKFHQRDLEGCKQTFKAIKEIHGGALVFSQLLKRRAQNQCEIEIKLGGDPFAEKHVTTFSNLGVNDPLEKKPFVQRARLMELRTPNPVIIMASGWNKPDKKKKDKVRVPEQDEFGKPDEVENLAGFSVAEKEERLKVKAQKNYESKRFVYAGKSVGYSTADNGQPLMLEVARDMHVALLSDRDTQYQNERSQREIRKLMEERAFEYLKTVKADREVVRRSPHFIELVNQWVDNRLKTIRVRYLNDPISIPEEDDDLELLEIKYSEGDEPAESDERFFQLMNLEGNDDLQLWMKGNMMRTGWENFVNASVEWEICWDEISFAKLTLQTFLGYEPDVDDLNEVIEWRKKYKIIKRITRYIDESLDTSKPDAIEAKRTIKNYSSALEPFDRARFQKDIDDIPESVIVDLERDKWLISPGPDTPKETHSFFSEGIPEDEDIRAQIQSGSEFDCPIDSEIDRSDSSYCVGTDTTETDPDTNERVKLVKVFNGRKCVLRPKITRDKIIRKIKEHPTMNEGQKEVLLQFFRDDLTGAICQAAAGTGKTYTLAEFLVFIRYKYVKFLALCVANNNEATANIAASVFKAWQKLSKKERKPFEVLLLRSSQAEYAEKIAERTDGVNYAEMTVDAHLLFLRNFKPSDKEDGLDSTIIARINNYLKVRMDNPRVITNETEMVSIIVRFSPNLRVVIGTMEKVSSVARLDIAQFIFADEAGQTACSDLMQLITPTKCRFACFFGDRLQIGPWCPFLIYKRLFFGRQESILDVGNKRARVFRRSNMFREVKLTVNYRANPMINDFTSMSLYNDEIETGLTADDRSFLRDINFPAPKRNCPITICHSEYPSERSVASRSVYNLRHEDCSLRLFEFIAALARENQIARKISYAFHSNYEAPATNLKTIIEQRKNAANARSELYTASQIFAATNTSFQGKEADVCFWHTSKSHLGAAIDPNSEEEEIEQFEIEENDVEWALNPKLTTTGCTKAREMLFPFGCVGYLLADNARRPGWKTKWEQMVEAAKNLFIPIVDIEALLDFYESKGPSYTNWHEHYRTYGRGTHAFDLLVDDKEVSFIADLECTKFWASYGVTLRKTKKSAPMTKSVKVIQPAASADDIIDLDIQRVMLNVPVGSAVTDSECDVSMRTASEMDLQSPMSLSSNIDFDMIGTSTPSTSHANIIPTLTLLALDPIVSPGPIIEPVGKVYTLQEKVNWKKFASELYRCNRTKSKELSLQANTPKGRSMGLFFSANYLASNFYLSPIVAEGRFFPSSEYYYIFAKCTFFNRMNIRAEAMNKKSCSEAKTYSRAALALTENQIKRWHENGAIPAMRKIVYQKFYQNNKLREKLVASGDLLLVEASANDQFWGIGLGINAPEARDPEQWRGLNHLGVILSEVRLLLSDPKLEMFSPPKC